MPLKTCLLSPFAPCSWIWNHQQSGFVHQWSPSPLALVQRVISAHFLPTPPCITASHCMLQATEFLSAVPGDQGVWKQGVSRAKLPGKKALGMILPCPFQLPGESSAFTGTWHVTPVSTSFHRAFFPLGVALYCVSVLFSCKGHQSLD